MFVRRVVEAAVAGAVGENGAVPGGAHHVHIAGAALDEETGLGGRIDGTHGGEKGAHERIVAVAAEGKLVGAQLQPDRGEAPDYDNVGVLLRHDQGACGCTDFDARPFFGRT